MPILNRRSSLALIASAIILPAAVDAQNMASVLVGTYALDGRNPGGKAYAGEVVVSESDGEITFFWTIGDERHSGTALHEGRVVTVDWGCASSEFLEPRTA